MPLTLPSLRTVFGLVFIASVVLMGAALYLQHRIGLDPCALCISQRITYMVMGVLFLIAALHNPGAAGRRIYGVLQFAAAATGVGIAARHIWIQANPDKVMAECGAGFDYIFETFPLKRALDLVFKGTGECSAIDWTMFGLTIPQLSLVAFIGLAIYTVYLSTLKRSGS